MFNEKQKEGLARVCDTLAAAGIIALAAGASAKGGLPNDRIAVLLIYASVGMIVLALELRA